LRVGRPGALLRHAPAPPHCPRAARRGPAVGRRLFRTFRRVESRRRARPTLRAPLRFTQGGNLHNHAGAEHPESIFAICTDPTRSGGDTFYTRAHFTGAPDAIAPAKRFHNIRQHTSDRLDAAVRQEYVRLDALTPEERLAWCNSLRLDAPGEGRDEFFRGIWPRRGQIGSNLHVITEPLNENIKAFGAEHLAYLETQFDVDGVRGKDGTPLPTEEAMRS
jgi:adenosine deaminase CECR1